MADSETTTPAPADADAELLHLGKRHMALLRIYDAVERLCPEDFGQFSLDAITDRLTEIEERIARIPAHTLAGLHVRAWALWGLWEHEFASVLAGPSPENADPQALLVWGILKDTERLLAPA